MGDYGRSLFPQWPLSSQSPDYHPTSVACTDSGGLNTGSVNMISSLDDLQMKLSPGLPDSQFGQVNQTQGWFYCLPRFRQGFALGPNYSTPKEKLPINYGISNLNLEKKFLVFDQSGDQTTVMMSSGPGTPLRCMTSWTLKQPMQPVFHDKVNGGGLDSYPESGPTFENGLDLTIKGDDIVSEMREDTEELNALLYSDDEDDRTYDSEEGDEVTSTGHSPSTMTVHDAQCHIDKEAEQVASSGWPKKRKRSGSDLEALGDNASSGGINGQSNYLSNNDDDAESCCHEYHGSHLCKVGISSSESKRIRRDKIREIVGLLQEMIPGGKGKDSTVVLDEAIDYIKSLKVQAKALGFTAL